MMTLTNLSLANEGADIFVPDGVSIEEALKRTTHLAVGAHHDDLEIAAYPAIEHCFENCAAWFAGVVVTDGRGSSRTGPYEKCTDEEIRQIRRREQIRAAMLGDYGIVIQLDYRSSEIKGGINGSLISDLKQIVEAVEASEVISHQPLDRHPTHIAVFYHLLEAMRSLPANRRPDSFLGAEVWGKLDWLSSTQKMTLNSGRREHLAQALIGVFDSQIAGGKRYDLGEIGHRHANATFGDSHSIDEFTQASLALDLSDLLNDPSASACEFALDAVDRFRGETKQRLIDWER
tara:strand:+ start:9802 stop:10671 length:870 start_codon:yes stop_codon:yes gene_type:complete